MEPSSERDWYVLSSEEARQVAGLPGLRQAPRTGSYLAHRSVAALLGELPLGNSDPGCGQLVEGEEKSELGSEFPDGTVLRPHQEDDVAFLRERGGCVLANQMRLGKTAAIVASHDPDSGPLVVVGPLATRNVWRSWISRRFDVDPEAVNVLAGKKFDPSALDGYDYHFVHYDILRAWAGAMGRRRRIGTLVFDEAHLLSNRKSKRTGCALEVTTLAHRRVCATGTPLWNKLDGLWSVLNVASPNAFGRWWEFATRYCSARPGQYGPILGRPSNVPELSQRLGEFMRALVWADLGDPPPTHRTVERVAISPTVRRELDTEALAGRGTNPTEVGDRARYRRILADYKARAAVPVIEEKAQGGPVVAWCWHKSAADILVDSLNAPVFVIGSKHPPKKREAILDAWQGTPDGVLVMSISIGQAGIDLSHASQAVFVEIDWTPAAISQAEMRTFSPIRANDVVYMVADHPVDEALAGTIAAKCEVAKLVGTPASDSEFHEILGGGSAREAAHAADLASIAAAAKAWVDKHGTSFEDRIRRAAA